MNKPLSLLLFLAFLSSLAFAQQRSGNPFALADSARKANPTSYQAPLQALRKIIPLQKGAYNSIWGQAMMTYQSFAGNYDSALYYYDRAFLGNFDLVQDKGSEAAFAKENYFRSALTTLPAKLLPQRVVMLNEAHHLPSHRAFGLSLLEELYKMGFRHIALEALAASDTAQINKRRYPIHESGFYLCEPLFAEFLREALKKGFNLVSYESNLECTVPEGKDAQYCNRFRDSVQAQNLARWVKNNPDKKLFVYAGYDHIYENSESQWMRMAEFFKKFTGIDPYTIDQVQMNEHALLKAEDPRYRAVSQLKNIQSPMVAYVDDTVWSHSKGIDVTIFHPSYLRKQSSIPRYQIKENRPDFYLLNNRRKPLMISKAPTKTGISNEILPDNTRMIMAFYQKEEGNRIPADVVELKKGQTETLLFLSPGAYEMVYLNDKGQTLMRRPLHIR